MRSCSVLAVLLMLASFTATGALGQNTDLPPAPPTPLLDITAPLPVPIQVTEAPPAPPRERENLQAQIDEQRRTIQWLTETVKSLQIKAADSAPVPWWSLPQAAGDASVFPAQANADAGNTGTMQPNLGGDAAKQPGTGAGGAPSNRLGGGPPFVNMPDSLGFKSPNGQHEIHLTGQIQLDDRVYKNPNDTTDIDEFYLRRARLGVEGVVFNYYEFRILPDFGNNKQFVLQDALANIHYVEWFQIMGGKFKEPVSFEEAFVQDRFVPTIERSIIDQITPQRDVGFMLYGRKLLNDQVDWYAGVFNGEINADVDTNKTKDYAGRIVWRPLNYELLPEFVRPLQIGVSATVGAESEPLSLTGPSQETLRTSLQVPWLTFLATAKANGVRDRVVPEVTYFYGPFNICAEFMRMDQAISAGTGANVPRDVRFEGYMVTATYMLTGEAHKGWGFFKPDNSFDPSHPWTAPGAWEAVAAISRLQVDSSIFHPGAGIQLATPVGQSDGATEITFGFNWYLNGYVRVLFNWEHAFFDQPVILNTSSNISYRFSNALFTRLQLAF